MADMSKIEWTDATWNPVTGCTKVSPGCKNCYAERFAERFRGTPGHAFEQGFDIRLWPERLGKPLDWRRPRRIFVNSMSDLFHEDVTDEFIDQVFVNMARAPWHTFQVLTKRPERMAEYAFAVGADEQRRHGIAAPAATQDNPEGWPLPNLWLGTSVENQDYVWRVDEIRKIPAKVRFLSCEPLLGPLDLDLRGIHWVIVGGESGPHARPCQLSWVRSIVEQCTEAHVPVFVKQLGAVPHDPERLVLVNRKGGDIDEWPTNLRIREFPSSEFRLEVEA